MFIDIDSLLRPVYGHAKQGASYGHTKIAGKQILRKGLSPLATTISTPGFGAGDRRAAAARPGEANSGKGAGRMVAQAIGTARAAGASGQILVRGDSAYGNRAVVAACVATRRAVLAGDDPQRRDRARRSPPSTTTPGPRCAIPARSSIPTPVSWISDAEVAEIPYTAFASTPDRDHRPTGGAPGQRRPLRVPRTRNGGLDVGRRDFSEIGVLQEMKGGPSESPVGRGLQTTTCCVG